MNLLANKKALVTGGSRGIGKEIVLAYLNAGADVAYVSTKESPEHSELMALAQSKGRTLLHLPCNVADEAAVEACVKSLLSEFGNLDILVNNAGITRDGLLFGMKSEHWDEVLKVNLSSAFYFCKPLARQMALKKTGSIINMSSVVGIMGNGGQCNYAASKAGLIGFTKSLARELATRNVRANCIAPGFIQTDMTGQLNEKQTDGVLSQIPMGRMGATQDIANAAVFLASDMSSYITGQVLTVDGGMAI